MGRISVNPESFRGPRVIGDAPVTKAGRGSTRGRVERHATRRRLSLWRGKGRVRSRRELGWGNVGAAVSGNAARLANETFARTRGTRVLPLMFVRQTWGHFNREKRILTGLHYPKILAISQQKPGKRNFSEK